jgi:hypothetical protein
MTRSLRPCDLVVEIDPIELSCRIFEGFNGIGRPEGMTAHQAMDIVLGENPEVYARVMDAARRAAEYLTECVKLGKQPS